MTQPTPSTPQNHLRSARPQGPLRGRVRAPGDKSISHRSLMLGAVAAGETHVTGLLEGEDVIATARAVRAMGAVAEQTGEGKWRVAGLGVGGLHAADDVLDMGNAGTGARLLMGLIAGHDMTATLTGDASLCRRPMGRVTGPLEKMGAHFAGRDGGLLPMTVTGAKTPIPIEYKLPVASAQVKSAILLAGLNAPGVTTVIEPEPTRDHTENMLRWFGADVRIEDTGGGRRVSLVGQPELVARDISVPADISSAAFPIVAALVAPGSEVVLESVGLNPLRAGLLTTLWEMGANIEEKDRRVEAGEPVADLVVRASTLKGVSVPAARAPSMIDEYPVLAVAAALADGETLMEGLAELRVKESDRLASVARGLAACGVPVEEGDDYLVVRGTGGKPVPGGATIHVDLDHRIAMAFLVLGLAAEAPVVIDDASAMDTSFPGFADLMNGIGANIAPQDGQVSQGR
ncbi:MAG: 3-phosphoshikimate 1-carboxyvinyltransferase [Rhodospirillaceae bacterium]